MLQVSVIFLLFTVSFTNAVHAQVVTESDAVRLALANYPSAVIADLAVVQQQALERTAFNPEQPSVLFEAPTEKKFGFEAEQEFDFPTVYTRRSKWFKSLTSLAEQSAAIAKNELARDVRLAYLDAQVADELYGYYVSQDSLWGSIVTNSNRLYEAGEISKADQLYAEHQKAVFEINKLRAIVSSTNAKQILLSYTGLASIEVEEIRQLIPMDTTGGNFYFEPFLAQNIDATRAEAAVWKASRLPGLIFGYERDLDVDFPVRYKAGITVPLWQGQYKGEILALNTEAQMLEAERDLRIRQAQLERLTWDRRNTEAEVVIGSYQLLTKPRIDQLNSIYRRLYEGGETDFIQTMRNIADLSTAYPDYLEMIKLYNQSVIEQDFLYGKY